MGQNKLVVAVKGILEYEGKILMVKRSDYDEVSAGTWEIPGGKIDFGEEPEQALVREMKEEVGLNVTVGPICYSSSFLSDPNRQVIIIAYRCYTDRPEAVKLSDEHTDYLWATPSELENFLLPNIVREFKKHRIL